MDKNSCIEHICGYLIEQDIDFALVHQSALKVWGLDDNVVIDVIDVLIINAEGFNKLSIDCPKNIGAFTEVNVVHQNVRFWSPQSLCINNNYDIVRSQEYACDVLAPELVLEKLVYSPDFRLLGQARAKLAASINVDSLSDNDLNIYSQYVR